MPTNEQPQPPSGLEEYLGRQVVVDTCSTYIIVGTLKRIDRDYLTLEAADVRETRDGSSTKDRYIMEARKLGIRTNRSGAKVRIDQVVCISLLKDVEVY